ATALAVVGAAGVILGAVYMLVLVEKVFFGKITNPENAHLPDLSVREGFVMAPMIVLIVVMGLMPGPFLAPAKPAVDRLVQRFQQAEARLGVPTSVGTVDAAVAARPSQPPGRAF
ncbi:MAG: Fe-S-binding domain-containing protein, partial [Anaeromyxobacteraceae bacterium]|nr:Fe-S-binding domain-containing protein [Anaeromyxobacteraceae bacterium]